MVEERKAKIQVGYRVGSLTVTAPTKEKKNGYTIWECTCDCGNSILLDTRALQRGATRSCGCIPKPKEADLIGQRFGRLTALRATAERSSDGSVIWECLCDCGTKVLTPRKQLISGYKRSCGCLGHPPLKDWVGKQFGQLTVVRYSGKVSGAHQWECLCRCGNTIITSQSNLKNGHTKSCGCLQSTIILDTMKFIDGTSVTMLEKNSSRLIKSNRSGHNGVHWNSKTQKWIAQIGFKRKTYHLGCFKDINDAVKARKEAEDRLYGDFLEWYYSTHEKEKSGHLQPDPSYTFCQNST